VQNCVSLFFETIKNAAKCSQMHFIALLNLQRPQKKCCIDVLLLEGAWPALVAYTPTHVCDVLVYDIYCKHMWRREKGSLTSEECGVDIKFSWMANN